MPWLYLKGVSSGEMGRSPCAGTVGEYGIAIETVLGRAASEERLDADRWVYVWADGIYSGLRAEQSKLCALVVIGVARREAFSAINGINHSVRSC